MDRGISPFSQNLYDYCVELRTFSQIPPNTSIHKDRYNHFIPTSGGSLLGGQTVANVIKGHSSEKLAQDISDFAQSLIQALYHFLQQAEKSNDDAMHRKIFRQFFLVSRELGYALFREESEGGFPGLMVTYQDIRTSLEESIQKMKGEAFKALTKIHSLLPKKDQVADHVLLNLLKKSTESHQLLPYCPEKDFTEEEWEELIKSSALLKAECVSLTKYATFSLSLSFTETVSTACTLTASTVEYLGLEWKTDWQWWNKILTLNNNASIYLGALPLEKGAFGYTYRSDLEDLKKEGIGAILSVVEVYENISQGTLTSPITPLQWKEAGIKQLQLPTPDFQTIPIEVILRGVEFLHWNLINGRSTLVHCKAGHGRSFLIIMCYLMKYHHMSAMDAYECIKSKRSHAGFSKDDPKMQSALEFEKLLKASQQPTEKD